MSNPPAAGDFKNLARARARAEQTVAELTKALNRKSIAAGGIEMVVAAGSLGRLETHPCSDADCIVFVSEGVDPTCAATAATLAQICALFDGVGLRRAKADGIFAAPLAAPDILMPHDRGRLDESPKIFGSRIQVLLDARALFGHEVFEQLQSAVLQWYTEPTQRADRNTFSFLINDLQRYLHAYAAWQYFKLDCSDSDGWYLRQAKMRSTRIVTIAGLMFLLGVASGRGSDAGVWLRDELSSTPIERVANVMTGYGAVRLRDEVLRSYDGLMGLLSRPSVRRALVAASRTSGPPWNSAAPESYQRIHDLSDTLMAALTRFVIDRADEWPINFFRNWLL